MNEWNIQTRAHQCQACGKGFEDKAAYHTLLFDEKREGYVRRDICGGCWKSEFAEGADQDGSYVSYWQGTYEAPPPTPPEPIQKENAESLLRKLIDLNRPDFAAAGYILAVMLERKRQLKIKEQLSRDGQRVFLYEQPKTGDIFTILDPALQLNQLEAVQTQVADLLEYGLTEEGQIAYPPEPVPESEPATQDAEAVACEDSETGDADEDAHSVHASTDEDTEIELETDEADEEEEYDEDEEDDFDGDEDFDEDDGTDEGSVSAKDSNAGGESLSR